MRKIKKYLVGLIIILAFSFMLHWFLVGYPLVLDFSSKTANDEMSFNKGDIIKPFENYNFKNEDWVAYIFIAKSDQKVLSKRLKGRFCLKATNISILQEIQKKWKFKYTGGDITTSESKFLLCKNGKKIFESNIILEDNLKGIQNDEYGWLDSYSFDLISTCKKFDDILYPIIIIK